MHHSLLTYQLGGRFPSDMNVNRDRAISPSTESEPDHDTIAAAAALPGGGLPFPGSQLQNGQQYETDPYRLEGVATHTGAAPVAAAAFAQAERDQDRARSGEGKMPVSAARTPTTTREFETIPVDRFNAQPVEDSAYFNQRPSQDNAYPSFRKQSVAPLPVQTQTFAMPIHEQAPLQQSQIQPSGPLNQPLSPLQQHTPIRQNTNYGEWLAPAAAGAGVGALGAAAYNKHEKSQDRDLIAEPELETEGSYQGNEGLSNPTTGHPVSVPTTSNTLSHHEQPSEAPREELYAEPEPSFQGTERATSMEPNVTASHALPTQNMPASNAGAFTGNAGSSGVNISVPIEYTHTVPNIVQYRDTEGGEQLGGRERKGAHSTGQFFPSVVRHDTDMSVSKLHVPGEFPGEAAGPRAGVGRTTTTGSFVPPSQWDLVRE